MSVAGAPGLHIKHATREQTLSAAEAKVSTALEMDSSGVL